MGYLRLGLDEEKLAHELRALPPKHRAAFAASCAERLLPNYCAFAVMEQWGNPALLRQALDEAWSFLKGAHLPEETVRSLVQSIEPNIPDSDDFTTIFKDAAIDACAAVIYTLECCIDGDIQRVVWCARSAVDTIYEYLNIVGDPEIEPHGEDPAFDAWVEQAPLLRRELEKQHQDLEDLKAHPVLDANFLDRLRQTSSVTGIQPFARGLVKPPDSEAASGDRR